MVHVAILCTSKAIHREAVLILYSENTFLYQSSDNIFWNSQEGQSGHRDERLKLGWTEFNMYQVLVGGPSGPELYWISHLELYFGNLNSPVENRSAAKLFRKLAKRPNQLKTLRLELWNGLGSQRKEENMLRLLEQARVSQRLTLVVWFTKVCTFDFERMDEWQDSSTSEGAYAVESASVEINSPDYLEDHMHWTRYEWVMVPESG